MSNFSPAEVARLGDMARITLTPDELERLATELNVITEAVRVVTEAAGSDVPVTSHPIPMVNVFRPDEPAESLPQGVALATAPEQEDGQFKVPQILGEEP
jgi:aspartyl-tRNA(Asn)/glutamyl-tRNA(Gln) amidotransferase subunit C